MRMNITNFRWHTERVMYVKVDDVVADKYHLKAL